MSNSKVALFACTKCNSRHPFDELSQGQQLCKVSDHRRDTAHCKQCNMTLPVMCVMCICRCRGAAIEEVCKCSRRRGFYSLVTQLWSLNFYVICGLFMMFWCLALNQCMFFLRELNWVKSLTLLSFCPFHLWWWDWWLEWLGAGSESYSDFVP